jgi:hypothetical protein
MSGFVRSAWETAAADERLVVDQQHLDGVHRYNVLAGSATESVQWPPSSLATVVPPSAAARSSMPYSP